MLGLEFVVYRTKIGTAMRAVSLNPRAAQLVGVNNDVVISFTFGLGSALAAAGGTTFEDGLRVVRLRGRFMQEAVPEGRGAMAAVVGASPEDVAMACDYARADTGRCVSPANFNAPSQTVKIGRAHV